MTSTTASLTTLLDRRTLRRLAGTRSFARGEAYYTNGLVGSLTEDRSTITAKVRGTESYRVTLRAAKSDLEYSCSCPVGQDGEFCKHCVAVGLEWLAEGSAAGTPARKHTRPVVTMDDVRSYVTGQTKGVLVEWLMEQAAHDDRLRQGLLLKATKKGPKGLDVATWRRMIDNAVDWGEFIDYRDAYAYARGIEDAVDSIAALLKEGHNAEVIDLTEHALAAVEEAMGSVDDSDGNMSPILERLEKLHHTACRKVRPDPEELARRLFAWELRTDWDTFFGAAATYADVLGRKGLAVYRALAEAEWAKVPTLGPGHEEEEETYGGRFRITHIMATLAQRSGDVDALVAIKQRDLSWAYCYLEIAEIYKKARRYDLALEWAERGLQAFPKRTDSRLREFLSNEYHRRKRHEEAMALVWLEFTERPSLQQYRNLKSHADRARSWRDWRERALTALRQQTRKVKASDRPYPETWAHAKDNSELVRIFLWEKDVEAAWCEARDGGCSDELWMELAARREKDHPDDAFQVHQRQLPLTLSRKNNDAYREAIGLLRAIRGLMVRLGRGVEFTGYLESVRAAHKPKRNFMKLLDRAKW